MTTHEQTSATVASIAARGLRDPGSLTHAEIKRVCASALTQAPNKLVKLFRAMFPKKPTEAPD